jgi:uncharacterized lipoprotein NlpE involved in copper resistance
MKEDEMDQERAEVELTIQIGMETDEEALAVLGTEVRKAAKRALARVPHQPEYVAETQWCSGAMRVTVRRPHLVVAVAELPQAEASPR